MQHRARESMGEGGQNGITYRRRADMNDLPLQGQLVLAGPQRLMGELE